MITSLISRLIILLFGLLLPAYKSYKTVKTKNGKQYVKWLIYWIVFALFMTIEMFTDVFLSWFPFYYEIKILFVFWLLSPFTRGATILFTTIIHPQLAKHEQELDGYISQASDHMSSSLQHISNKGLEMIVSTISQGSNKILESTVEAKKKAPKDEDGIEKKID